MTTASETCPKCFVPVGRYDKACGKCGARLDGAAMLADRRQTRNPLERFDVLDQAQRPMRVVVTDLDMPIGSMVVLLLKLAVASIPAAMVISLVGLVLMVFFAMIGAGLGLGR